MFPEVELGEYNNVEVPYQDPEVTEEDIDKRIEEIREQKAQYINIDPRPVEDGDFAVVSLESLEGVEGEPVKTDEMVLEIGAKETFEAFTENLRGLSPGDEKEFEVTYPEDYGVREAGRQDGEVPRRAEGHCAARNCPNSTTSSPRNWATTVRWTNCREAVRKAIFSQRQHEAQQEAKNKIVDKLVDAHEFPVPEAFVERQIKNRVEQRLRAMAEQGIDPRKLQLDWEKVKESQREKAVREVKASMLLGKVSERESIRATRDEVDGEVEKAARQMRKPVAAVHMEFEKDGTLGRIASHIQTEKTLNFLFEHARKTAES